MRRLLMFTSLLLALLLLIGCSNKPSVPTTSLLSEEAVYTSMMMQMDDSRPDRKPDYCGVVKSLDGKEVTISLAEVPARPRLTPEQRAQMKKQDQPRQRPPLKMTGVTKKFTVASNTKIMKFSKQNGRINSQPLALADIKEGNVLMAWVEGETVVYLQVFPCWGQNK